MELKKGLPLRLLVEIGETKGLSFRSCSSKKRDNSHTKLYLVALVYHIRMWNRWTLCDIQGYSRTQCMYTYMDIPTYIHICIYACTTSHGYHMGHASGQKSLRSHRPEKKTGNAVWNPCFRGVGKPRVALLLLLLLPLLLRNLALPLPPLSLPLLSLIHIWRCRRRG